MSPSSALRRVRAYPGQFILLAVLAMVTALLITGIPRAAHQLTQQGLRQHIAAQPVGQRDLTYSVNMVPLPASMIRSEAARLDRLYDRMPQPLRDVLDERWYAAHTSFVPVSSPDLTRARLRVEIGLRTMSGVQQAATLTGGRWPGGDSRPGAPIPLALSEESADRLGLRLGSRLRMTMPGPEDQVTQPVTAVVVGTFTPKNTADGIWHSLPTPLRVAAPPDPNAAFLAVALTSEAGLAATARPITLSWRYRMDPERVDPRRLDDLIEALAVLSRMGPPELRLVYGMDRMLRDFADSLSATRNLLAVISSGVLAALAGLIGLAAALAVRRRRSEFALLRARGGSVAAVAGRSLIEALLVVPPAAGLGWALGLRVPGASDQSAAMVLVAAVLTTMALPAAVLALRSTSEERQDLGFIRPSVRRLTAEATVLFVTALATVLLRRRGLPSDGTVDPLLAAVPVLLAVAAAILALRAYPWPLWLAANLAARSRGSVLFLGLARAGRSPVMAPLVVVVVAVATAGFCGVLASGITQGRDSAATRIVPGDALLTGDAFAPQTVDELAELPGVRAVAPLLTESGQRIQRVDTGESAFGDQVTVLLLDGPQFARVVAESGVDVVIPDELPAAVQGGQPLPALVSPALAADLDAADLDSGALALQGERYTFRVTATVSAFPLVGDPGGRYLVAAWPQTTARPLVPNAFLLAGSDLDQGALRRVGDEGQRRHQQTGVVTGPGSERQTEVKTWSSIRADLGGRGVNGLLFFGFGVGTGAAVLLGVLAIAFAVLAGARARAQVISRLRTLGLSRRQWRGLLAVELIPLVVVSVLTGAAVGALLPLVIHPVLGLSWFTGGVPVPVRFEPGLIVATCAVGALALGIALTVEALSSRRMRLGAVLGIDEGEK